MTNPYPEVVAIPLEVCVAGVCDDSTVAGVFKGRDDTKVMEPVARLVVVDVVDMSIGVFSADYSPRDPVGGVLTTTDLDLNIPVFARDCSGSIANGHTNSRFHFPVKATRYNAVVENLFDVFRNLFHTRSIPQSG